MPESWNLKQVKLFVSCEGSSENFLYVFENGAILNQFEPLLDSPLVGALSES